VTPESHKLGQEVVTDRAQSVPAAMPGGSVVFFLGTLWHASKAYVARRGRFIMKPLSGRLRLDDGISY